MAAPVGVYLAAEDRLGLALGRRLIAEQPSLLIWRELNARGFGDLKRDVKKFDNMAGSGIPVIMLTDLDTRPCCKKLFDEWLGKKHKKLHPDFLLRVCQREAEAWLFAHPDPLAQLFHLPLSSFPVHPELLSDPKSELLKLAARAPARIRRGLLPAAGSTATIGFEYNNILCPLVEKEWDINAASTRAPSLARARARVLDLATRVAR